MIARAAVVLVMLAGAGLYSARASSVEAVVPRVPLSSLPLALGEWHGREAAPLPDDVLAQLGVDDYVNRQYARAGAPPVGLYVGYYASQRQGDTIHSPQNCLPGAGWLPVETAVTTCGLAIAPCRSTSSSSRKPWTARWFSTGITAAAE